MVKPKLFERGIVMAIDMSIDFGGTPDIVQESYNPASSGYTDLFGEKFNSFDPDSIISGGNNRLKSGMFAMEVEDSDLALGYKHPDNPTSPKPGRFM